jgi:hypothetical protein
LDGRYSEVQEPADILLAAQKAGWGPIQHGGESIQTIIRAETVGLVRSH